MPGVPLQFSETFSDDELELSASLEFLFELLLSSKTLLTDELDGSSSSGASTVPVEHAVKKAADRKPIKLFAQVLYFMFVPLALGHL